MKNRNKEGKDDNQTKEVYCLKPVEATEGSCNNGGSVSMATSTTENSDRPLARVIQCFLVKTENILVQNPGEEILINKKSYVGVVDACSNITLCNPHVVPREQILQNQTVRIKGINSTPVTLPMAKVKMNYGDWVGIWDVAISDQIPAPCLIGLALTKHVQSACRVTCSLGEQLTIPEGKMESLISESNWGCLSLEENPEVTEMAEEVILKTLMIHYFLY